jgi:DNA-binding response OmpR family regulator
LAILFGLVIGRAKRDFFASFRFPMTSLESARRTSAPGFVILLVEEDVLVRLSLADYLRGCGFVVIEAAHGDEARAILVTDTKVDVVFCDAQLSARTSGFAFAQWVRRRLPRVSLILTATVAGKAKAAADLCAATPACPKPCEPGQLTDRIQARLARAARKSRAQRAQAIQRAAGPRKN